MAAAAATVHSPSHRVVLREKVLLPVPSGLRSFPVNLHLIWFWFERNPGEDDVDFGGGCWSVGMRVFLFSFSFLEKEAQ